MFPLLKTGGLADVTGALPAAQIAEGLDTRVLLPGFPAIRNGVQDPQVVASSRRLQISSSMGSPQDVYFASVKPARRTMPSGYALKPCTRLFRPKMRGSK